jgi:integrase
MSTLSAKNIERGFDRELWLVVDRKKTNKSYRVPLLPKAVEIMRDYLGGEGLIFPKVTNQKFNSYLKEIADIVGIEKNLTHHIARKTFASTVLLYNDVPIEIVSELLGHSSIKVTQESYARLSNKKVSETMIRLSKILK